MERTEYFNHTRPSETQLNNTEDTKIDGVLRRTAFLRNGTESLIKDLMEKIKEIEADEQPVIFT